MEQRREKRREKREKENSRNRKGIQKREREDDSFPKPKKASVFWRPETMEIEAKERIERVSTMRDEEEKPFSELFLEQYFWVVRTLILV